MGLLDDAIREHLDLQRRRGADPAEIERAEREALGPVRRGAIPPDEVGEGAEPAVYDEAAPDQGPAVFEEPGAYEEDGDWDEEFEDDELEPGDARLEFEPRADDDDFLEEAPAGGALFDQAPGDTAAAGPTVEPDEPAPAPPPPAAAQPPATREPAPLTPEPVEPGGAAEPGGDEPLHDPGEETAEYEVEAALAEEGGPNKEDMLEETPEFLQDTPDHDRLWFEQRPPRDFDFEG